MGRMGKKEKKRKNRYEENNETEKQNSNTMVVYTLISADQKRFELSRKAAMLSELVCTMVEGEDEEKDLEIPLPNIKSNTLEKIVCFCVHHETNPMKEIEKPVKSSIIKELVPEWDAEFIDGFNQPDLYDLILAANYMDFAYLLDLACAKIASTLKGKTSAEIRESFGITEEFTAEEEAKIMEEHKWISA